MGIGSLGLTEIVLIVALVVVFFGPGQIPEVARTIGRTLRDLQRGMNEVRREFEEVERSAREPGRPERGSGRAVPEPRHEESGPDPTGRAGEPADSGPGPSDDIASESPTEPPHEPQGGA